MQQPVDGLVADTLSGAAGDHTSRRVRRWRRVAMCCAISSALVPGERAAEVFRAAQRSWLRVGLEPVTQRVGGRASVAVFALVSTLPRDDDSGSSHIRPAPAEIARVKCLGRSGEAQLTEETDRVGQAPNTT